MNLVLIRGLPGSGKTTIAKTMDGYFHVEADMYFETDDGYKFNPSKLADAHAWCLDSSDRALSNGLDVVVANTFTTLHEMQPYINLASKHAACRLSVIEAKGRFPSVHNVPYPTIRRMMSRWEDYTV